MCLVWEKDFHLEKRKNCLTEPHDSSETEWEFLINYLIILFNKNFK